MKTTIITAKAEVVSELETVAMSIDQASAGVLMSNLTNLYSNPNKAVFREYVSNALDSHIKAGVSTPIEVSVPKENSYNPVFVVRDYGVGLSKDEIVNVYSRYGSSTKRDSNTQIGAFGLGAKSALAITDRFDIVAIKDGQRVECFIQKNSAGVGVIHFVSETATTDANGVEVRIPVADRRVADFVKISADFFDTWKANSVILNGELVEPKIYDEKKFLPLTTSGDEALAWVSLNGSTNNNRYYGSVIERKVKFVMGGIAYTLGTVPKDYESKLGNNADIIQRFASLAQSESDVYLNLPIGSVDLTPSREDVMFTDKTVNTIVSVLEDFISQAPAQFEMFLNTLDRATAVNVYGSLWSFFGKGDVSSYSAYRTAEPTNEFYGVSYKGEPVPTFVKFDKPAYIVSSVEGSALGDVEPATRLNIIRAVNGGSQSAYTRHGIKFPYIIVEANGQATIDEANLVRKNLRDYSASVYNGSKNIFAIYTSEKVNAWVDAVATRISADDMIEIAKTYRKNKKSVAQVGTTRSKATYVAFDTNVANNTNAKKVDADSIVGGVVYISEDADAVFNYTLWSTVKTVARGDKTSFDDTTAQNLRGVFAGSTVIFLTTGKSADALVKRYPNAVKFSDAINAKVMEVNSDKVNAEVLATLSLSKTRSNILEVLSNLDQAKAKRITNEITRKVALALLDANSTIGNLINYTKHETDKFGKGLVVVSGGFDLAKKYSLLNLVSLSYRQTFGADEQEQAVSFINLVDGETKK